MTPWRAPYVHYSNQHLDARVEVPGSKSLMNRYLVLAALSEEQVAIRHPLIARDTLLMADALRSLGAEINTSNPYEWIVKPGAIKPGRIFTGLAGTVMRFVPPIAALADGDSTIDGDPAARLRPMAAIVDALQQLGIRVSAAQTAQATQAAHATQAALPITIHGKGYVSGGAVHIDAAASSQFISGLLLAAPRFESPLDVYHTGSTLPSQPHINMTIDVLRRAGVNVIAQPNHWHVSPGCVRMTSSTLEPDLSNAAPFLAAAMILGGTITIPHWPAQTTQPGNHLRTIFETMGAHFTYHRADGLPLDHAPHEGTFTLAIHSDGLHAIRSLDMDLHDVGELVPTLAAVAAFADGTSHLRNIGQLRGHETDRLAAISHELRKLGAQCEVSNDALTIHPAGSHGKDMHGAVLASYADHRMATFGAIIGLAVSDVYVDDIETTSKTLPNFTQLWQEMLA